MRRVTLIALCWFLIGADFQVGTGTSPRRIEACESEVAKIVELPTDPNAGELLGGLVGLKNGSASVLRFSVTECEPGLPNCIPNNICEDGQEKALLKAPEWACDRLSQIANVRLMARKHDVVFVREDVVVDEGDPNDPGDDVIEQRQRKSALEFWCFYAEDKGQAAFNEPAVWVEMKCP